MLFVLNNSIFQQFEWAKQLIEKWMAFLMKYSITTMIEMGNYFVTACSQ